MAEALPSTLKRGPGSLPQYWGGEKSTQSRKTVCSSGSTGRLSQDVTRTLAFNTSLGNTARPLLKADFKKIIPNGLSGRTIK